MATTYGVTASFRNPNPSTTDEERKPDDSRMFMYLIIKHMAYFRNTFWLVAAAEIATILLAGGNSTSADVTKYVLRILMPRGQITDLRLTPLSIAGSLLVVAGCWLRLKCYSSLQELFTFEMTVRKNHRLVTSGPYSYIRHPSYTGSTTIFIGICCWLASRGSWVRESGILESSIGKIMIGTFMALYFKLAINLLQRMPEEDKLMKAHFGKEWEEWAGRVPYQLIPYIY